MNDGLDNQVSGVQTVATGSSGLLPRLKTTLDAALGFFYPEACQICGAAHATPDEGYVCQGCQRDVRYVEPPMCEKCGRPFEGEITTPFECHQCRETEFFFRFARSAVAARGVVMDVIHRYKYNQALWFEPFLARILMGQAQCQLQVQDWDFIVPVPLHYVKKAEREFNQAERLAAILAAGIGLPLNNRLLKRVKPTTSQTMLTREERSANMRQAFELRRANDSLAGARIILVDDVFTTGATTNACARVLRRAGAADIGVWTLARGL